MINNDKWLDSIPKTDLKNKNDIHQLDHSRWEKTISKKNTYRNYGSIESFCSFIFLIIKNFIYKKKKIPLTINYCSEYNLSITDILKVIKERFKRNKKIKIKFKNGTLKKTKKLFYKSIYSKKFKFYHDWNFIKEIDNLIFYCKSNFRNS